MEAKRLFEIFKRRVGTGKVINSAHGAEWASALKLGCQCLHVQLIQTHILHMAASLAYGSAWLLHLSLSVEIAYGHLIL